MTGAKRMQVAAAIFAGMLVVALAGYALWYTHHRTQIIAQTAQCKEQLAHPPTARTLDGSMVRVMTPCRIEPVPPTLGDLLRGRTAPSGVPEWMRVDSYTFWDALLGRYSVSPNIGAPCNQGATTTDCATLLAKQSPPPSQDLHPRVATTTETVSNFTFSYPKGQGHLNAFGWEGVVFPGNYTLTLNGITNYTLFFFTKPSPLSSINPVATTLDDYRSDYPISTSSPSQALGENGTMITPPQTIVHIISSEDVTFNGIAMLRQRYSVGYWATDPSGHRVFESSSEADVTNELRYVFFDGTTFVVLTGLESDGSIDYVAHTVRLK